LAFKAKEKSPHRILHEETSAIGAVDLFTMQSGDVFIREGAPCMMVSPSFVMPSEAASDSIWICNLQTGSVWPVKKTEQVYPATDVFMTLRTTRRG